jgi:6-phosphogluconolactonase
MIRIFDDYEHLSQAAADMFMDLSRRAIDSHGRFNVALSGGNTPKRLYEILANFPYREEIHWEDINIFWGDERCVPHDDPRSNFGNAGKTLLNLVPIPDDHIYPISGSLPAEKAAVEYEADIKNFFKNQPPVFNLILLGLGDNAHTASLFPHTHVLDEKSRWVGAVHLDENSLDRVTLTAPFINQAEEVIFLVSGAQKAAALQNVLEGSFNPHEYPAQLIHPKDSHPIWLVDKAAAHKLAEETIEPA